VIPDGLPADPCVVILAFRMRQQRDVDAWTAALGADAPVVEVPVMSRRWRRAAGWIEGGMASGTPEAAHGRVWCAYAPVRGVLADLGVTGTGDIVVVVADRSGRIRAMARGAPAPAAVGTIRAALAGC
jgi:hypothetical protein